MRGNTDIPHGYGLFRHALTQVTELARPDLEKLCGGNILLAGCTSFFGKWLTECLLWANAELHLNLELTLITRNRAALLARMPHFNQHAELHVIEADATRLENFPLRPFTHAVHAVNLLYEKAPSWPACHIYAAIHSTEQIMKLAEKAGCQTVLYASSGGAYGVQAPQSPPFTEEAMPVTLAEPTIYGNTKRFVELYIRSLGQKMNIATPIARLFAFAGAYNPLLERLALGSCVKAALQGKRIIIKGDGLARRSFLDARDMTVWTLALLARGKNTDCNIGSSHDISIKELAQTVLRCANQPDSNFTVLGNATHGNAPDIYIPDISHAIRIGLTEHFTLEESIKEMISWYRLHPEQA